MTGDITTLFQTHVRNLKRSGSNGQLKGRCPFHPDEHPSFSVNLETGYWICHAGCGEGDAAIFAEKMGLDPKPYYRGGNGSPPPVTTQPKKETPLPEGEVEKARTWYSYLIANFSKLTKDLPWTKEAVKKAGVGYDPDAGRFIYVHRDSRGNVLNIKHGKGSGGLAPYNVKGHGHNGLYPGHLLGEYDSDYIVLAEGEKDVTSLISKDFPAATGTAGAGSVPKDLSALRRFEKIYICFDHDKAGREGAFKWAKALSRQCPDSEIYISHWSESEDKGFDVTDFFARGQSITDFKVLMLDGAERYVPVQVVPETRVFEPFSPRLGLDSLTPALREFLRQASPTTDAPDEFLITAYLTCWAGAVGNKLLGPSGLRPNLWTVLFAGSSEVRKSTALTLAGGAAKVVQKRFDAGLKEAWAEYKVALLRWDSKPRIERAEAPEPEKPTIHSLLLPADFSDAGFYEALKNNPVSGVIVAPEFADFHRKLNRDYTAQADAFLSAYDNERMSRQTRSHELETIEEPTFSILGGTTFENFRKVFRASETENGFFQRVFPVAIPTPTKRRKLYLQRSKMEPDYVQTQAQQIKAWLDHPGDLEIEIPPDTTEAFSAWETGFVSGARGKYGERIGPHIERLVPGCLKLAMLCESLEVDNPETVCSNAH